MAVPPITQWKIGAIPDDLMTIVIHDSSSLLIAVVACVCDGVQLCLKLWEKT